ncbi:MAG: aminotransferase class IV family protein [Bacteroidales bacterium]|nr:aminotransferase class IV family protein [Bacteroidales bacterium]
MKFIIYNGEAILDTSLLTINNRAFRYGDGLFESFRTFNGQIPFLSHHLLRLKQGMKILSYNMCDCLNETAISNMVNELCLKNEIAGSARIRLTVFRKDGGLYTPEDNDFDFLIEANSLDTPYYDLDTKGLIIGISKTVKKPINQLSKIKSTNALLQVIAAQEAKKHQWNEALILNESGNIAEGISSNLFIVKGKNIFTPPLNDGALDGIMRQQIAHIIKKSSYKLSVKSISPSELASADEIFLTNAVKGIIWVVGYGNKRFFSKASKELVALLNDYILMLNNSNLDTK